ncbi:uncharacterized protein [Rutidosis leptorrhynchoides]|uniref:uncharacterized protein n=1 Tax=Rutidosis leptorrhynchoides TaxID=125765 RepID=UPI003A99A98F
MTDTNEQVSNEYSALVIAPGLHKLLLFENESGSTNKVPKLDNLKDFLDWKLIENEYAWPNGGDGEPKETSEFNPAEREQYNLECKCYAQLTQVLSKEIFFQFKNMNKTSHTLWLALQSATEGTATYRATKGKVLKDEWRVFSALPSETLGQTLERYRLLVAEMTDYGIDISDDKAVRVLKDGLPEKWDNEIEKI